LRRQLLTKQQPQLREGKGRESAPAVSRSDNLQESPWASKALATSPQRLVETELPFPEWVQGGMGGKFTFKFPHRRSEIP